MAEPRGCLVGPPREPLGGPGLVMGTRTHDRGHRGHGRGQPPERELGLTALRGKAGKHESFHVRLLPPVDQRAAALVEGGRHADRHAVPCTDLHGARMHDLRPRGGELDHVLVIDGAQHPRATDAVRVGSVDAIDIGEDVAAFGVERTASLKLFAEPRRAVGIDVDGRHAERRRLPADARH